jgi:hypothetical protein
MCAALNEWKTGWTIEAPVSIGYAWAGSEEGDFLDLGDGLLRRDLNLESASAGALSVHEIRPADTAQTTEWRALDVDFDFLYVLVGETTIEGEDGTNTTLGVGGCAIHPPLYRYRFANFSEDFSGVHVTSPATFGTAYGDAPRPSEPSGRKPVYSHDTPDQYVKGNGPRSYFLYRDLGAKELTDGRVHFHIVRATQAGPGTGWHWHTMSQWFMVIGGTSVIRIEDKPHKNIKPFDCGCVGSGPDMRHNVTKYSADYAVLEMCVPADYDTTGVDEPEGADGD